jgi:hypothetical protein
MEEQLLNQMPAPASQAKTFISVSDLFSKSFDLYKKKAITIILLLLFNFLILAAFIPLGIIFAIVAWLTGGFTGSGIVFGLALTIAIFILAAIGIAAAIIISLWSGLAMMFVLKEGSSNIGAKDALRLAWPKIASYFWVSILVGLVNLAGFILLIIPGVIFSIWFGFSLWAFASEGLKGKKALARSKQLVSGNWWGVFGRFLLFGILAAIVSSIPSVGQIINFIFVTPFSIIYGYLMYESLKELRVQPA